MADASAPFLWYLPYTVRTETWTEGGAGRTVLVIPAGLLDLRLLPHQRLAQMPGCVPLAEAPVEVREAYQRTQGWWGYG